ncbi:MAG: DNA polymerase III subunit delta [Chitinivibrionia bacterium]|nr:DNA polymerase III subunit delta [Chitinivibrionia bacterium]
MGRTLQQYKALFDSIGSTPPRRIYLLYGREEYLKKEIVSALIQAALPGANRTFNLDIFYGDEFDRNAFNDRISSFPLFAARRMVILKKYEDLAAAHREFVVERLAAIPESLTVVIESAEEKADAPKLKAVKSLADANGVSFDCRHLSEEETLQRVRMRLKKEGFDIEPDALKLLVESVGTQMLDLANELDKVAIIARGRTVITRDIVKDVVGRYRAENVFMFLERLETQDLGDTLKTINALLDGGEEPVFILAMLLRRVLQLMQGARAGGPSAANLELLLENLMWADEKMKTSQISERTILEEAFIASHQRKKLATFSG